MNALVFSSAASSNFALNVCCSAAAGANVLGVRVKTEGKGVKFLFNSSVSRINGMHCFCKPTGLAGNCPLRPLLEQFR